MAAATPTGHEPMNLFHHLKLAVLWRREFNRVRSELSSYSERELSADLRLNRSDIPAIAAEAADEGVTAFVRSHPAYRGTPVWRGGLAATAG
jgi:uncharacterized protein YjiS (DUF1127 family)